MKSQLFFKYLSELMHKIQASKEIDKKQTKLLPTNRHRKTFSDCTSDKAKASINGKCQNTLLAMESKPRNSDMQIDSRQIYNPDLLWRRKNSLNGLSFGRVDEFGRFERDFEISPVSSLPNRALGDEQKSHSKWNHTQNKIKNAVRKLVNLPEDKVQEEIAWQVAEMIVKDVTNVTLNSHA